MIKRSNIQDKIMIVTVKRSNLWTIKFNKITRKLYIMYTFRITYNIIIEIFREVPMKFVLGDTENRGGRPRNQKGGLKPVTKDTVQMYEYFSS